MTESIALGNVSVAIGMPVGKPIPAQTVSSLYATAFQLGQMGIACDLLMQICGVVTIARDSVLDEFLRGKADKLFWIDSDMAWGMDEFLRMLALSTKYDVIAAAYPSRSHDGNLFQVNTDGLTAPRTADHGLFEVNGMGLGFCIVSREACEALAAKAPRVRDGYSGREMAEVFRVDRTAAGFRRTEDIAFFDDLREMGFTVWCDPSIELGHVGEKEWRGRFADALTQTKET